MTESNGSENTPDWEKRFRAPRVSLPDWAEDAPDRSLFVSNATGTYELYAWDRATGEQRQVTDRPNGTTDGVLSPDGEWIWWFDDKDGDEFGVWRRQPFKGGPDEPAVPGLEPSYPAGVALARDGRTAVVGRSTDEDGTTIHLARTGDETTLIYRHRESAGVGDLSHDGSLIAVEHTEHGDAMHSALRVLRPDGTAVADLDDTKGGTEELGLEVLGFAPVDGDTRLLIGHQRRGRWEPLVWDVVKGGETDLSLDLPGDVSAEWYPDGSALLIAHSFEARSEVFRYDLASGGLEKVPTPPGSVSGATARPDGSVEYLWSSAAEPSAVRSTTGEVVLDPPGLKSPGSVPVEDVWVEGPGGRIHALVQKPRAPPAPPHGLRHPRRPDLARQRLLLCGPGGLGRPRVRGRPGQLPRLDRLRPRVDRRPEVPRRPDRAGGHRRGPGVGDHLRPRRPRPPDPHRRLLGRLPHPPRHRHPARRVDPGHRGGPGRRLRDGLPRRDGSPEGHGPHPPGRHPEEVPARFEASSPLTYVDKVTAPVYISAGVNDPRCPIRQIDNYVKRLESRGAVHEVYRYDAGHGSLVVDERIKQVKLELDFAERHLGK